MSIPRLDVLGYSSSLTRDIGPGPSSRTVGIQGKIGPHKNEYIGILIITSINKREKNSNFHPNTSRAYLYHSSRKIERSAALLIRSTTKFTQLQKKLLTMLSQVTLSLALSVSIGICLLLGFFFFFFCFSSFLFPLLPQFCVYNIKVKVL